MSLEILKNHPVEPHLVEVTTAKGVRFRHYEFQTPDFSKVEKPKNVNGFVLDSGDNVLLVEMRGELWGPPGGKIETGETPIQALHREMEEEAAVVINQKSIRPLFYSETFVDEPPGTWKHLGTRLRYVCRIQEKHPFLGDPDGDITNHVYCKISDLGKYVDWGETTPFLIAALTEYAKTVK